LKKSKSFFQKEENFVLSHSRPFPTGKSTDSTVSHRKAFCVGGSNAIRGSRHRLPSQPAEKTGFAHATFRDAFSSGF
jgi:hypothetical protein